MKNFKKNNSSRNRQIVTESELHQALKSMKRLSNKREMHYIDTFYTYSNVTGTNVNQVGMTLPASGTSGLSGCISGRLTFHSFEVRIVTLNLAVATPVAVRLIMFQQIGDSVAATGDVLENVSSGAAAVTSAICFKNRNTTVKHLCDIHLDTDPNWNASVTTVRKITPKIKDTKYSAIDATWSTGQPVMQIANTNVGTGLLNVIVYVRINFLDGA